MQKLLLVIFTVLYSVNSEYFLVNTKEDGGSSEEVETPFEGEDYHDEDYHPPMRNEKANGGKI